MHARKPAALRLRPAALFGLGNDRVHFRHDLVMGNAGARIIERGLHLGAEPAVIAGRLFFGFEFRDDGGEDGVHGVKVTPVWPVAEHWRQTAWRVSACHRAWPCSRCTRPGAACRLRPARSPRCGGWRASGRRGALYRHGWSFGFVLEDRAHCFRHGAAHQIMHVLRRLQIAEYRIWRGVVQHLAHVLQGRHGALHVVYAYGFRHACSGAAGAIGAKPNKERSSDRVSCWPIISSILSFGHSPRSTLARMAAPTRILRRVSSARFCLASAVFTLASAFCFNALACLSLSSKSLTRCCAFSMLVAMIALCGFVLAFYRAKTAS